VKNTEAKDYKCSDRLSRHMEDAIQLQILSGNHAGAVHPVVSQKIILVGSGHDCDLILSDPDVAVHHCLISRLDDELSVRPMDAEVVLGPVHVQPGDTGVWLPGQPLSLGAVTMLLSPETISVLTATDDVVSAESEGIARNQRLRSGEKWWNKPVIFASFAILVTLLTGTGYQASTTPLFHETEAGIAELDLAEDLKEAFDSLQAALSSEKEDPENDPEGMRVAANVREILRLSGIRAKTRYLGQGQVEVVGHLGDERAAAAAIKSRAMHDIKGLEKIVAINLDMRSDPVTERVSDKRIVSIVNGRDPYLIADDGSRYYVGALFPNGKRLLSIEGQNIYLETEQGPQRVVGTGAFVGN
jgi:hypothetical protein